MEYGRKKVVNKNKIGDIEENVKGRNEREDIEDGLWRKWWYKEMLILC